MLGVRCAAFPSHDEEEHEHEPQSWQLSIKVVWPFQDKWTVDTLPVVRTFHHMQTKTPCSDYIETKGLIYFARMLDKIRLKAAGELAPEYFTGVEDPTHFDARCTRFLGVNYDELVERTR